METAPLSMLPPVVVSVSSTALKVTWSPPQITNGLVQEYLLKIDGNITYRGLNLEHIITDLTPYRAYVISVTACTRGGCVESASVQGRPLEDAPSGLRPPTLLATSSTSVEVIWEPPTNPNGIITSYDVKRNGSLIETRNNTSPFADYRLTPGTVYEYTVTAYNSKGSVTSAPVSIRTYSSSPSGVAPPQLIPRSSTEIEVRWSEPAQPNGDIISYSLYRNYNFYESFQPNVKSYLVKDLKIYTEFTFQIQACTSKGCAMSNPAIASTMEAAPKGQGMPQLERRMNNGKPEMFIFWQIPTHPNGALTQYEVHRRRSSGSNDPAGPVFRVCLIDDVTKTQCLDSSDGLLPYTQYEYRVTVYNSKGSNSSKWADIVTAQAAPQGLSAPVISDITSTTLRVEMPTVARLNGILRDYIIYVDGNEVLSTPKSSEIIGLSTPALAPFTDYNVSVLVCTDGGCTMSPKVKARTKGAAPGGINPPVVVMVTSTSITLRWTPPNQLNGVIQSYDLYVRKSCPNPPDQPLFIECTEGQPDVLQVGQKRDYSVQDLKPYQDYAFMIKAYNAEGSVSSTWTRNKTLPSAPLYKAPPKLSLKDTQVIVDWRSCFEINGRILSFVLFKDGSEAFNGLGFSHAMERESRDKTHEFYVRLKTEVGQVDTPVIVFDPNAPNYIATTIATPVTPAPVVKVYEEVWFIVLIALIVLLILFIGLALCLRYTSPRSPYIRERMPLAPRQMKPPPVFAYSVDPYDGSIVSTDIPPKPGSHFSQPMVGYENPAFTQMSGLAPLSHHDSMLDYNYDRMSQKSSKLIDDEYDDPLWDGHLPNDSGLHSYAPYDDDFDNQSSRPYSVVKEHVMFTDTHL